MPQAPAAPRVFRFEGYEVDLAARRLSRRGIRIRLREKSFQVLASLLERPGQVVTREQLRQQLWPEDVFVDFDSNLNTAVARLREALGDSADHPRFIETLPRHGYRFLGKVFEAPQASEPTPASRASAVVLPFINLSGDLSQEYFSDAMTDAFITELARIAPEQLAVIARTTAMRYKGSRKDVARIGRELGVDYVVEGGVHRAGERIAVNIQLIRAKDQTHIWAQRCEAELNGIFTLQTGIARAIAERVGITPAPAAAGAGDASGQHPMKKPTENLAAYNEYIKGRYEFGTLSPEALAKARQHFEEAIARDPNFALAYDSLAEIYWWLGYFGFMRPTDAFSAGVLYAVRALEIDNTLAETHALLAQYHKQLHYDWAEVDREMARALALDPYSPLVRVRYAWNALMPHGRLEQTLTELEFALKFDPLSTYFRTGLASTLLISRCYDRALAEARRLIELDPKAYWGHHIMGACYRERRMFEESIAAHRKAVELSHGAASVLGWLGLALGASGRKAEPRALLKRLHAMAATAYVPPSSFAWVYIGLGEMDAAFECLDRAVDACDQYMMPIKSYPFLDPLRPDPRFAALLRKMNLKP